MKSLHLFVNRHMKAVAVIWAACLVPIKYVPAFGYVVIACIVALCALMFVGDYIANWVDEI